jgi:hypothetical protein
VDDARPRTLCGRVFIWGEIILKTDVANDNVRPIERVSLEQVSHHEAGHAVMHLMYGDYIKSVSVIPNHRRYGRVVLGNHNPVSEEEAVMCLLAGPVAETLYANPDALSEESFFEIYDMAHAEGIFEVVEGRRKITMNRYFKHLSLCVEVMGQPDFREAVNLLAGRLVKHKYLSHERVIRLKDDTLWNVYDTSRRRISDARKTPTKMISQMVRQNRAVAAAA